MNARSVSISAARKLGKLLFSSMLFLMAFRPLRGSDIIATITGIVINGADNAGFFGTTKPVSANGYRSLSGEPFKVVFTFDDTKGKPVNPGCGSAASGIAGDFATSPGTAVLTINGISRSWGKVTNVHSFARREINGPCSKSRISFEINEGDGFNPNILNVYLIAPKGGQSLTQTLDWKSPLTLSAMDDAASGFVFGDVFHRTEGDLETHHIVIEKR